MGTQKERTPIKFARPLQPHKAEVDKGCAVISALLYVFFAIRL